ncbi:hypothetical protein [Bradyrhizobium sp. BWA-3-5]|uniref:hypothetical protein n=1 Tax=Bradyrhizobium sp. BWA-3-5 TaxID=3080013 RepID=UPI00293EEA2B|nr:hypothetical protein [Bradyrhizobium sp. BWA-3-5]WOH63343.1 hypothetical protein RX331_21685 [Bradyrhizobium sp. BWA-3-5]
MIFFAAEWVWLRDRERPGDLRVASSNGPEGQAMGQQVQGWRSASGQRSWLLKLIETMEQISRPERRAVPCDAQLLATVRAQLARPALARSPYASNYSLRN